METFFVIIFVFIMKFLTYFLPEIITLLLLTVIVGFFIGMKSYLRGEQKSIFPDAKERYLHDIYKELLDRKQKSKGGDVFR